MLLLNILNAQSLIKIGITYTIGKEQSLLGKKQDLAHESNVNSSFGAGLSIDFGYVYLNNSNFGPEFTFSFFVGKPKTVNHVVNEQFSSETIINKKVLFFSPSLFIIGNSNEEINPYLSSGLLFNLWENISKTEFITDKVGDKTEKKWKVNYNKGIGYKSKIGILYASNNTLLPFIEMQYQMISIAYKNETLMKFTTNNKDLLETLSESEKKFNYQLELNQDSNYSLSNKYDKSKPTDIGMKYANHNHFGTSSGIFIQMK